MILYRQFFPWLIRAWPVLIFIPVGLTHVLAVQAFYSQIVMVNKLTGMCLQIIGGLLVLYSVNENLGIFRKQSLAAAIHVWLKEFPIKRAAIILTATGVSSANSFASAAVSVGRSTTTIEERLEELERLHKELRKQVQDEVRVVKESVESVRHNLQQQISDTSSKVSNLSQRIEHTAVGGFKLQAAGVLLALYGAVTSVFA